MIRDHERAVCAQEQVSAASQWPEAKRKSYGAICMKLPILVHQAGLAPALHHVAQLPREGKKDILDHLAVQLKRASILTAGTREELLTHVRAADTARLVSTTREIQRCLEWYRRFAKSILKADVNGDDE